MKEPIQTHKAPKAIGAYSQAIKSGDFLFQCLFKAKISNQPNSENLNDGLKLKSTYITNILKCVPPGDKPTSKELTNCFYFFKKEIQMLKNSKIFLALGKIAFDACIQFYKETYFLKNKDYVFAHAAKYQLPDKKILIGCYHPSPRNVNTKRINLSKMVRLFKNAKKIIIWYIKNMKIYLIWLVGVIVWNFGVPQATPLQDVLVAIVLSFLSMGLKKYLIK